LNPALIGVMIPIIAIVSFAAIALIAMFLEHQRRMAKMLNDRGDYRPELEALRREVHDLRNLVNQQAMALDDLGTRVRSLPQQGKTTVNS